MCNFIFQQEIHNDFDETHNGLDDSDGKYDNGRNPDKFIMEQPQFRQVKGKCACPLDQILTDDRLVNRTSLIQEK